MPLGSARQGGAYGSMLGFCWGLPSNGQHPHEIRQIAGSRRPVCFLCRYILPTRANGLCLTLHYITYARCCLFRLSLLNRMWLWTYLTQNWSSQSTSYVGTKSAVVRRPFLSIKNLTLDHPSLNELYSCIIHLVTSVLFSGNSRTRRDDLLWICDSEYRRKAIIPLTERRYILVFKSVN